MLLVVIYMDILLPFEYLLYLTYLNVIRNVLLDDPDDIPQVLLVVLPL